MVLAPYDRLSNAVATKTVADVPQWKLWGWPSESAYIAAGSPKTPYSAYRAQADTAIGETTATRGMPGGPIAEGAAPVGPGVKTSPGPLAVKEPASGGLLGSIADTVTSVPLNPVSAVAGLVAGPAGLAIGEGVSRLTGSPNTVGETAVAGYDAYMTDVPVVSPFMRETVAPAAGAVGTKLGETAYDIANRGVQTPFNLASSAVGGPQIPGALDLAGAGLGALTGKDVDLRSAAGTAVGETAKAFTPITAGDLVLSLLVPASSDLVDIGKVLNQTGVIREGVLALQRAGLVDDTGRALPGVTRAALRTALQGVAEKYDDVIRNLPLGPRGSIDEGLGGLEGEVRKVADDLASGVDEGAESGADVFATIARNEQLGTPGRPPVRAGGLVEGAPVPGRVAEPPIGAVEPSAMTPSAGATSTAPVPLPRGALPGATMEEQLQASLKLGREGIEATRPQSVTLAQMRQALDDVGMDSTGTTSQVASRYRGLQAEAVGGINTPTENVSNAARTAYGKTLEATGDPEAARLAARKAAAREQAANVKATTLSNRFGAGIPGGGPNLEREVQQQRLADIFEQAKVEATPLGEQAKSFGQRLIASPVEEIGNGMRQAAAGADLSYALRQGGLNLRHGREYLRSVSSAYKALGDETYAVNRMIDLRSKYRSNLFLSRIPGESVAGDVSSVLAREENYASDLIGNLPVYRQTGRANTILINEQRAGIYDTVEDAWERTEGITGWINNSLARDGDLDALANYINRNTGRGTLGPLEDTWVSDLLGLGFFSPRFLTSRPQAVLNLFNVKHPRVAIEAWKDFGFFLGATTALLGLASESGLARVELDPTAADFGKFRVGKVAVDPFAGFQQIARFAARMGTGAWDGDMDEVTTELERFLRTKLAPLPGTAYSLILKDGENMIGEKVTPKSLAIGMAPIFAQGIIQSVIDGDSGSVIREQLPAAALDAVGLGTQVYENVTARRDDLARELYGADYDNISPMKQAELNFKLVEQGIEMESSQRLSPWWSARDAALEIIGADNPVVGRFEDYAEWREFWYDEFEASGLPEAEWSAELSSVNRKAGIEDMVRDLRTLIVMRDPGIVPALDLQKIRVADSIREAWAESRGTAPVTESPATSQFVNAGPQSNIQPSGGDREIIDTTSLFRPDVALDPSQVKDKRHLTLTGGGGGRGW